MSETIIWSGYEWLTRQPWGSVHDDPVARANCWYDPAAVKVQNGVMSLDIIDHPNSDKTARFGVGLLSSVHAFGYGVYTIEAQLPRGCGLWPAFWMYEEDRCIPEIDIFEGYSSDGNYRDSLFFPIAVQSCLHCEPESGLKEMKARSPWFWQFAKRPDKRFCNYTLVWGKIRLDWYINGFYVRQLTDIDRLKYLRDRKMTVIINNHFTSGYNGEHRSDSPFYVKYFKYVPI